MTKREMFLAIREIVADNAEMVSFIDHEVELLSRKSNSPRKPTKTQLENEGFKVDIVNTLVAEDRFVTIKELCELCPSLSDLTNQRITHMLTDLRKAGKVERTYIKKVAYFSASSEQEGE